MKTSACILIMVVSLGWSGVAQPPGVKTHVLTGPVLETCCPANAARGEPPMEITMEKGKELIVFSVAWNAKVETQPKVGDVVTVHYWIGSGGRAGGVMYTASKIEAAKGPKK